MGKKLRKKNCADVNLYMAIKMICVLIIKFGMKVSQKGRLYLDILATF